MDNKKKSEGNNQWAGANTCLTEKTGESVKSETNNQWTSTNKKSNEMQSSFSNSKKSK